MINLSEVIETNSMIEKENLDVRTITLGISLLGCMSDDLGTTCRKVYDRITTVAKDLVKTGEDIERDYAIPIVNKRISITPAAIIGAPCARSAEDFAEIARTLDKAARETGVNFLGGFSALPVKGMTAAERLLPGPGGDREGVLLCRAGVDEGRHQHGCGTADGRDCQEGQHPHGRQRFLRLREARRLLQRA